MACRQGNFEDGCATGAKRYFGKDELAEQMLCASRTSARRQPVWRRGSRAGSEGARRGRCAPDRLRDTNAVTIAKALYPRLLSGEAIDVGVSQAHKSIFQQSSLGDRDWGALVLYLRSDQGVVFLQ